jgi:hypothetical protein
MNKKIEIAIVGTGASAFGVTQILKENLSNYKVTIFDITDKINFNNNNFIKNKKDTFKKLKKDNKNKFNFPPPKNLYGYTPSKSSFLFDSEYLGGNTNFWGGAFTPFPEKEFRNWEINFNEIHKYYKFISKEIPITGSDNIIKDNFLNNYSNTNSVELNKNFKKLYDNFNLNKNNISIKPILAIKNKYEKPLDHSCQYPGSCLSSCLNHNIFSTFEFFNNFINENENVTLINERVINFEKNGILNTKQKKYKFDKVFICSGVINTAKIIIRSFNKINKINFLDSQLVQFPLLDLNLDAKRLNYNIPQLMNIKLNINKDYNYFQIYQTYQYLLDYYFNEKYFKLSNFLFNFFQLHRIIWFRGYSSSEEANTIEINLNKSKDFEIILKNQGSRKILKQACKNISKIASKSSFYKFLPKLIFSKTSAHYGCSIPYKNGIFDLKTNGEILESVYLCDSSVFNTLPSISPTFTIMANASRTTFEALNG